MNLSLTCRPATQDELEGCEVTDHANLTDGSWAVLRDSNLIGLTDEYGTCVWVSPDVRPALIEHFCELAGELIWLSTAGGAMTPGSRNGPGTTTRRKPVKGVGRNTARLYCAQCGHKKTECICPK